jgi:ankyrin repeat protein
MGYQNKALFNQECHDVAIKYIQESSQLRNIFKASPLSLSTAKSITQLDSLGMDDLLSQDEIIDNTFKNIHRAVLIFLINCMIEKKEKSTLFSLLMPILSTYHGIKGSIDDPLYLATLQSLSNYYGYNKYNPLFTQNENGNTALHRAIRSGHVEIVTALLQAGVPTNLINVKGLSALYIAVVKKDEPIVRLLLKYNANIHQVCMGLNTPTGLDTPFSRAYRDDKSIFTIMLEHAELNEDLGSVLVDIAENNELELMETFLSKDIHHNPKVTGINIWYSQEKYALHWAIHHKNEKMISLLLKHHANMHLGEITALAFAQKTDQKLFFQMLEHPHYKLPRKDIFLDLLFRAVYQNNSYYEVLMLISKFDGQDIALQQLKKDINTKFFDRRSLLFCAVEKANIEIVLLLLEYGADPHQEHTHLETPFSLAYEINRKIWRAMLDSPYFKLGPNIGCMLIDAAYENDYEAVKDILSKDTKNNPKLTGINTWHRQEKKALDWAVQHNNIEMVSILLAHGANCKIKVKKGFLSSLELATKQKKWDIVKLFGGEVPEEELSATKIQPVVSETSAAKASTHFFSYGKRTDVSSTRTIRTDFLNETEFQDPTTPESNDKSLPIQQKITKQKVCSYYVPEETEMTDFPQQRRQSLQG